MNTVDKQSHPRWVRGLKGEYAPQFKGLGYSVAP